MQPPLSTVTIQMCELGRRAAALLLDLVTGVAAEPRTIVVPWRLDVRRSTQPDANAARLDPV